MFLAHVESDHPRIQVRVYCMIVTSSDAFRCNTSRLQVLGRAEVLTPDRARVLGIAALAKVAIGADPQESSRKRRPAKTMAALRGMILQRTA